MRIFRRLSIVTAIVASLLAFVGINAAYATGPTYPFQYGTAQQGYCVIHVGGGTATGGAYAGEFDAYGLAGGFCKESVTELVWIDPYGNEKWKRQTLYSPGYNYYTNQILLPRSQYSRILEVEAYGFDLYGHETNIVYLYY